MFLKGIVINLGSMLDESKTILETAVEGSWLSVWIKET